MTTFLRLTLAGREGDVTLINVDHIVRILREISEISEIPAPAGSTIVLSDDTSVNVRASLEDLQCRLTMSGGRCSVVSVDDRRAATSSDNCRFSSVDEAYEAARADPVPSA